MTDARFTTQGSPALVLSGEGERPDSVEIVGPAAPLGGRFAIRA